MVESAVRLASHFSCARLARSCTRRAGLVDVAGTAPSDQVTRTPELIVRVLRCAGAQAGVDDALAQPHLPSPAALLRGLVFLRLWASAMGAHVFHPQSRARKRRVGNLVRVDLR